MTIDTLEQEYIQNLERQTFDAGEIITLKANCYWLLQQGIVKTYTWTEEGNPITFGYWGINDLIGQPLFSSYPYHIKCLTKVEARLILTEQTCEIITLIQRQIWQTEEILFILRAENMYQRLRQILIWLGSKFGRETELGKTIEIRLTHQDLAELIGATRVTITKLINQLESEGFIVRPRRNTIVLCR